MTVIKIKNSSVVGKTPAAGDLQTAELALNTADKKLYSKDTNGNIFEIGAGGDVPSGGTGDRPDSPTIGDLFYDTDLDLLLYWNGTSWEEVGGGSEVIVSDTPPATDDLEEGTLWWNSDAGDLSLYVLYNDANPDGGLKWIEASPMPGAADIEGYPNIGDGNGATLDDRYVSKTVADHKVGDLTIGPDANTPNITLVADGSATFAASKIDLRAGGSIQLQQGTEVKFLAQNSANGGDLYLYGSTGNTTPTASITGKDGSATFASSVTSGHNNTTYGTSIHPWGGIVVTRSSSQTGNDHYVFQGYSGTNTNDDNKTSEILANGSATFVSDHCRIAAEGADAATRAHLKLRCDGSSTQKMISFFTGSDFAGANETAFIRGNGSTTFNLEPDNPANYTTTTDSEGNETQVYNGPTLDVKERLEAAQETFQELLVAVQSATDFGELKAAMLVALEDYA